jgi:hypothetical protein
MVKRGLSKSMKKRIASLMNKKKLTVKDKKFLEKIQKGGAGSWGEWWASFNFFSKPTAQATPVTLEATAVSSGDDHTQIKSDIKLLTDNVCKICSQTGAECICEGGPTVNNQEQSELSEIPENDNSNQVASAPPADSVNGDGNVNAQNQGAQPQPQTGGRKSRKNKRRKSRKSAKIMAW